MCAKGRISPFPLSFKVPPEFGHTVTTIHFGAPTCSPNPTTTMLSRAHGHMYCVKGKRLQGTSIRTPRPRWVSWLCDPEAHRQGGLGWRNVGQPGGCGRRGQRSLWCTLRSPRASPQEKRHFLAWTNDSLLTSAGPWHQPTQTRKEGRTNEQAIVAETARVLPLTQADVPLTQPPSNWKHPGTPSAPLSFDGTSHLVASLQPGALSIGAGSTVSLHGINP